MAVQTTGFNDYAIERRRPDYHLVLTGDRFEQMIRFLEASPVLVVDTETSGLDWFRESRACGIAFAGIAGGETHHFYVPFRHHTGEEQLDVERISPAIRRLLAGPQLKVGHNLKFDQHILSREGWKVAGPVYDTMVAAKLYDENRFVALKTRAVEDLGLETAKVGERRVGLAVAQLAKQRNMGVAEYRSRYGYSEVPIWLLGEYACMDADFTRGLWKFYEDPQRAVSQRFARIWSTEMDLLDVLCEAEETGIAIDVEYLVRLRQGLRDYLAQTEARIRLSLGGRKLELGSDAAVRRFLLEELRCPLYKLTRGGKNGDKQYAVDKEVLAEFAHAHPAVPRILAWREAEKLANTYTGSILDRIDSRNYLHPSFQQVGTTSGRLSCTSPNFQNQPVDDDERAKRHSGKSLEEGGVDPWSIRRAYIVGKPGWVRLFFDYSQIELRVLAFYTRDPILVDAYLKGEDIHTRTSREVFGSEEKAMRRLAKVINFGLCISEGQRVLTQQDGLVPIERVQDHHLLWDGVEWVKHDGLVCRGVEEVLSYDGITATPDHVVYLRDGSASTLRAAAFAIYPRRLAVGAIDETPVRFVSVDRAGGEDSGGRCDPLGEFAHPQKAKVYDLINAGPHHRFTVEGKIVSNSYGLSPKGFSRQVHVPLEEAETYFRKFFERYRGIVDFRRAFWTQVRQQKGFFQNIFGRPRRITGLSSADGFKRGQAEREAIASLIQGTAAELTKESLVRIARVFKERSLPAQITSTVHDEIQIDCDARALQEVAQEVKALMEAFPEFAPIPIKVDGDYSVTSWADKKKLPKS